MSSFAKLEGFPRLNYIPICSTELTPLGCWMVWSEADPFIETIRHLPTIYQFIKIIKFPSLHCVDNYFVIFSLLNFMHIGILSMCVPVNHMHGCFLQRSKRYPRPSDDYELLCGCLEWNLSPLEEQQWSWLPSFL